MDAAQNEREAVWRVPAEWETQAAVWLSWPVASAIWPAHRGEIWQAFAELVALLSRYQPVCINAATAAHAAIAQALEKAGADVSVVELFPHATDDVWCRDHGPIWLQHKGTGELVATDWRFNAWGGKFPACQLDDAIPAQMAAALGTPLRSYAHILEGGAIESNGNGRLMTTESVLLHANRGSVSRASWEAHLREALHASEIIWLREGLPHDDTDGHIDNVARFFGHNAVLLVDDAALPQLGREREMLEARKLLVVTLPRPRLEVDGLCPPASYANFVVINGAVLVPQFGLVSDGVALGILQDCFPGRSAVGVDCRLFLLEGGGLHCLSHNQPCALG